MKGEPIPGEHWVEIDLLGLFLVDKVVIDWEVAFSKHWTVQVYTVKYFFVRKRNTITSLRNL